MNVQIVLEKCLSLPDFPSGSSINYRHGTLFLIGDDANNILILDSNYQRIDSRKLFDFAEKRIPKPTKPDLETSTFVTIDGDDYLLILGSASTPQREKVFLIPFSESGLDIQHFRIFNDKIFTTRLADYVNEVNIEGSTVIDKNLILSNRGNRKNPTNHFIVTEINFWEHQVNANLKIVPIQIPIVNDMPGVSELCYVAELDLLLITFSSEQSDNAYDDGTIGNSYIGWIDNIAKKLQHPVLAVDQILNLSEVHPNLKNEKIEGLCVESINGNVLILHLVSDNDTGESKLFKLKVTLNV